MKIGDDEYNKLESAFVISEYEKTKPKPNQMVGPYGWHAKKKQEFQDKLRAEGKLE